MKDKGRLYCFSPLVMIITFAIEIILAIYAWTKSIKAKSDVGIVVLLVFLAIFQLAEYQICDGLSSDFWSRTGFLAITFLPVIGLYLVFRLNREAYLLKIGFTIAIIFSLLFIFDQTIINNVNCSGNYVIFDLNSRISSLYGYYYFGFLLVAMRWFIFGYLSFILPLTVVYITLPITRMAVASIMCGFAVIFAFILTFKIAPIYHKHVKRNVKK